MSRAPKLRSFGRVREEHRAVVVNLVRKSTINGAARSLGVGRLTLEEIMSDGRVLARTAARVEATVEALIARGLL